MRPDRVEVSWDVDKKSWLVRITAGEEVIRRHCAVPQDADEGTLRAAVQQAVQDEGYQPQLAQMTIHR
jgi:hypothetical protein